MSKRMRALAIIGVLFFLLVIGLVGYFSYMNIAFVDTLHARVDGSFVQVRAPVGGHVVDAPLEVGDAVAAHEQLATLESVNLPSGSSAAVRLLVPVRAPSAGIVAEIGARPDDVVSVGQVLLTLVDPEHLWVTASIHETRFPQVRVGQSVRIYVRTRSVRRTYWGRVEQIGIATTVALSQKGQSPDVSTPRLAEVPIKISLDGVARDLYPGMTAEVRIRLSPRQ